MSKAKKSSTHYLKRSLVEYEIQLLVYEALENKKIYLELLSDISALLDVEKMNAFLKEDICAFNIQMSGYNSHSTRDVRQHDPVSYKKLKLMRDTMQNITEGNSIAQRDFDLPEVKKIITETLQSYTRHLEDSKTTSWCNPNTLFKLEYEANQEYALEPQIAGKDDYGATLEIFKCLCKRVLNCDFIKDKLYNNYITINTNLSEPERRRSIQQLRLFLTYLRPLIDVRTNDPSLQIPTINNVLYAEGLISLERKKFISNQIIRITNEGKRPEDTPQSKSLHFWYEHILYGDLFHIRPDSTITRRIAELDSSLLAQFYLTSGAAIVTIIAPILEEVISDIAEGIQKNILPRAKRNNINLLPY